MARFDPEKMAVYRLARQHNRAVHALLEAADTRGFADLVSQLRSSAISIPANLLEAAGEWRSAISRPSKPGNEKSWCARPHRHSESLEFEIEIEIELVRGSSRTSVVQ
jgi:hypothetical protein